MVSVLLVFRFCWTLSNGRVLIYLFQCADVNLSITSKHTRFKLFDKPVFQLRLCSPLHEAEILSTAEIFYFLDECGASKFKWCSFSSWILSIKIKIKNCITDTHNLNPITGMWLEQRPAFIVQCWWGKLPVVAVFSPTLPFWGIWRVSKSVKGISMHHILLFHSTKLVSDSSWSTAMHVLHWLKTIIKVVDSSSTTFYLR